MSFASTKKNWEGFARKDPLWAICTTPDKKGGKWKDDEFFAMGKTEIQAIFNYLKSQNIEIQGHEKCLDFGCGVGRLSRSLTSYFREVHGVDVSQTMINKAKEIHDDADFNIHFHHNDQNDLSLFAEASFDFIYTSIVLQHIPEDAALNYIREFIRICKPQGLVVFQIPVKESIQRSGWQKLKSKVRFRERMALLGIGKGYHMEMHCIPEEKIKNEVEQQQAKVLHAVSTNHTDPAFNGDISFNFDSNTKFGYLSQLFIIRKN
jgi:ubiquinone/menaquinone biosynthesis C-methylase UbiE